jgi:CheY-like chemotaxis protein
MFDPFFTTKQAGRGLGLAVVQGIIRAHGGAILLVSAPGQGTKFRIFLPATAKKAQAIQSPIAPAAAKPIEQQAKTVLVVEDEYVLRMAVSKALRKRGFSVIEAGDGSAAVDLIRAHPEGIDLLLLDVTIPGIPSRDVLENARRLCPDLKVIITSAYSRETVDASFAGLSVECFIRKPFQLGELVSVLGEAISDS